MGLFSSSEERIEEKTVDTTGTVNNNIILQEARDTHDQMRLNEKMLFVMYTMCTVEVVKLAIYVYCNFRRKIKKRYANQTNNDNA